MCWFEDEVKWSCDQALHSDCVTRSPHHSVIARTSSYRNSFLLLQFLFYGRDKGKKKSYCSCCISNVWFWRKKWNSDAILNWLQNIEEILKWKVKIWISTAGKSLSTRHFLFQHPKKTLKGIQGDELYSNGRQFSTHKSRWTCSSIFWFRRKDPPRHATFFSIFQLGVATDY